MTAFLNWLRSLFSKPSSPAQKETQANPTQPGGPAPAPVHAAEPVPPQTPSGASGVVVRGLDVSHYEAVVDYPKALSQGFRWVYAKATDGDEGVDAKLPYHRFAAVRAGLIFGAFCFNRFDADPVKQANHFMLMTGEIRKGELPPCLDVEWDRYASNKAYHDGGNIDDKGAEHCLVTLRELERLSGMVPVWYTHHFFFQGVSAALVKEFARYPLWLTQPGAQTYTRIPGLPAPKFFQNTFHQPGLAPQNPDGIDADIFYGSLSDLKALCR